ncbi:hypothetical protein BDQ12DRAFT_611456 [Crucibulum laeve]|uniref:DUF1479-domain-containing protein n=1 Tax=Crucibulum laeve TaxID=68775 RepID=A0A5C3LR17_9AGAR|nr:hypothetical protein BDQ12DRAFT_611456 [Crucibulum laeve]
MSEESPHLPPRFADLKREIAATYPDFQEHATKAWSEIIEQLEEVTKVIAAEGPDYIPQVEFSKLQYLSNEEIEKIRRRGSVVIKDVVDDAEAVAWKESLEEFIKANPDVEGFPENDKQFFQLYWTKAQVKARAHPNMLAATVWLNNLYHAKPGRVLDGVDLSTPLTYADRFRIRHPGVQWNVHPPHIDGGTIERWEDPVFRKCFEDILNGNWRNHDPYDLEGRLNARSSLYGRPNQSSIFRTFQGWLAMSETAPTQGTLKVFPDVLLSNTYLILRPFFRPLVPEDSAEILKANSWEFDLLSPDFPGIYNRDGGYAGPRPTPAMHPHMRLEKSMTSVPKVNPGDAVFWHCDVVHSVEPEHTGAGDSAVMYIPAVPFTAQNQAYVERQLVNFLEGRRPPDFPQGGTEGQFSGIATVDDIVNPIGKKAMGLPIAVA